MSDVDAMLKPMSPRALAVIAVVLGSLLGAADSSQAATGIIRIMISGVFSSATGTSGDGQITLRLGVLRPVMLVNAGAVMPGSIGTATVARWTDTTPPPGFGPIADLMVFRLGGGVMVVAGSIGTPGGPVTTFSATDPFETLSGTWTLTDGPGSGVTGAGASDAVVTFTFDTNPSNTISGVARFVADGAQPLYSTKPIQGLATVDVLRNIPVRGVANNVVGPQTGTLVSYSAYNVAGSPSEYVQLTALTVGGVYVLYGCAFPQLPGGIACPVGGGPPVARLSGEVSETNGQFLSSTIAGVDNADLVITLIGSLP